MLSKLHPNSRSAWMLVALTVMMSAGVVALFQFASTTSDGNILFTQFDGNDYEIFVMDGDGNIEQLTNNDVNDWAAGWSPDYSEIAFRSQLDGMSRIYVMNADGSDMRAITPDTLYAGDWGRAGIPTWSPDGESIAFEAVDFVNTSNNFDIFVVNVDNGKIEQITDTPSNEWHPDFSPNGRQIAFARDEVGTDCYNTCDIYVMDADGSNQFRYTYTDGMDVFPQWSPDGNHILFHSERNGNSDIYVMSAYGCSPTNLTNSDTLERVARWSPDGNSIVFRSERDGDSDIYVMNLQTGETEIRTDNFLDDRYPDW
ncbi:MAG: hypothetical protein AAFV93_19665 [Chloroflexota bacterium]